MVKRQILAMGGGGFLEEPDNPLLDAFFFQLAGKLRPKVCFVSTAGGDAQSYLDKFYDGMKGRECEPSHLSLYKPPLGSLLDYVLEKDVIYVGGGNTRNLLALWREWGLDQIFREACRKGVVLGGISAGSLCWFDEGVTDSITGSLTPIKCLGFLPGSNCVHYDGEAERRPAYQRLISAGMKAGYACDNGVAGYFVDEQLIEFVSSRSGASAYRVELKNGQIVERRIATRYLGG